MQQYHSQIDDQSTTDREWDEAERVRSHERRSSHYWYKPQQTRTHVEAFGIVLGPNGMPGIARGGVPEQANISIPIHNIQPLNDHSSDPSSRFYTELVGAKRLLLAEGYPSDGVLGPADIDVTSLLENRAPGGFQNSPSTLCQWAVNSVRGLEGMGMPEKLATILMTARLLRWQVLSTLENYQNLPDCMKPTALQTFVPHPAWINFVPWPDIRDVLITTPEALAAGEHLALFQRTTSVNWPWSAAEAIYINPATNQVGLASAFERYVGDINNWSLAPAVIARFPAIADKVWIK
ncbi:hypothetical protein B0A49_07684 [Cryomyces minteri]|uniref:Uncharacterized protein n=1 Tax=Cryomyces minteri TaxID=331657 RepID=A0A4U0WIT2_9PEZI|nr:hypothetical protein B0A49_07684 [Cryomyces minteri]